MKLKNVLNLARKNIPPIEAQYIAFSGRETNENGIKIPSYLPPIQIMVNKQPVSQYSVQSSGLDVTKTYIDLWIDMSPRVANRDRSNDHIAINGLLYKQTGKNNWFDENGWTRTRWCLLDSQSISDLNVMSFGSTEFGSVFG